MNYFILLAIFSCCAEVKSRFYNSTNTDLTKCAVHYSKAETSYVTFFEFPESEESPIPTKLSNDSSASASQRLENNTDATTPVRLLIDFHFAVLASSDAHILMAPTASLERSDPVYEIVLGAGGNSFCDIRRMQKSAVMQSERIKDLLSPVDVVYFWIHVSSDGSIEVGREGEQVPFIFWKDESPIPIRVFSFSTWSGVWAKWYFDCPRQNSHSKKLEPLRTEVDKLRIALLSTYNRLVRPVYNSSKTTEVALNLHMQHITMDDRMSTMNITGKITLIWLDEKLVWNTTDFANLTSLHVHSSEIWTPDLSIFNAVNPFEALDKTLVRVNNTGYVLWRTNLHSQTWCDASLASTWPTDRHTCGLDFGFMRDGAKTYIVDSSFTHSIKHSMSWTIENAHLNGNFGDKEHNITYDEETMPLLSLVIELKRENRLHYMVYYTPFCFTAVASLMSFWMSPHGHLKVTLNCFHIFSSVLVLMAISLVAPAHTIEIPYFVYLYSSSLVAGICNLVISAVVINITRAPKATPAPHFMKMILTSTSVQWILGLPKHTVDDEYEKLSNRIKTKSASEGIWFLMGVALDRIAFIIYATIITAIVSVKY